MSEVPGAFWNFCLPGEAMDSTKYNEMYEQKVIAHNLKAAKEQIIDDLNGVMPPLQRRMMKELPAHLDELNAHIRNLHDEIDNFMKPEEKQASNAIQEVIGIGNTCAQAVISVIGTDMGRFPAGRHTSSWAGLCSGNYESTKKRKSGRTWKVLFHSKSMNRGDLFRMRAVQLTAATK